MANDPDRDDFDAPPSADPDSDAPAYIEVPMDQLDPATLDRLLESIVLRDDADYGDAPAPIERRVAQMREALGRGELVLVFDPRTESAAVVTARELRGMKTEE